MLNLSKKLISIAILATLPLVAAQTFAGKSSDVTIPGDTIKPASMVPIVLNQLIPSVQYTLECSMTNPNSESVVLAVISAGSKYSVNTLDGKHFDSQTKLTAGKHNLRLENVVRDSSKITLVNADQQNTISLDSCVATAVSNQ